MELSRSTLRAVHDPRPKRQHQTTEFRPKGPVEHKLSLDQVIRTMYQTGKDMLAQYKETSLAGLALHVVEC